MGFRLSRFAVPLEAEGIVTDALRRGGRAPNDDGFLGPLRVLCEALDGEAGLGGPARRQARQLLVDWLMHRAKLDEGATSPPSPQDEPLWIGALPSRELLDALSVHVRQQHMPPPALPWGEVLPDTGLLAALDLCGQPVELLWHVPSWADWYERTLGQGQVGGVLDRVVTRSRGARLLWSPQWIGLAGAIAARPGARVVVVDPSPEERSNFVDAVVALRATWAPDTPEERTRAYVQDRLDAWLTAAAAAPVDHLTHGDLAAVLFGMD